MAGNRLTEGKATKLSIAWAGRHEEVLKVLFFRTVVVILVGHYGFLHFICPIQSGDYDADGPTVAAGAIQVGTGWLRDTAGNPAVLTHAALTANSEFKVDAILPYVTGVEITSAPDSSVGYATGETIEITVTFNETVTVPRISRSDVSGYPKPKITIDIGGEARTADFHSTDANSVLFTYDVTTGDQDSDGVSIDANKLSLNGGAIWDQARNTPLTPESDGIMELGLDAAVTHSALDDDSSHKVTTVIAAVTPLTAEFQDAPDKHLGTGVFTFDIAFSEPISIGYKTLRDDSLDVTNGSATKAKRVNDQSDLWEITVEPDSDADVTVVLPVTGDCTAQDAVCTRDGTKLSNRSALTVPGPAAANSPATGLPTISGTAQVGETLTVDTSGIDDADGMGNATFSYQWIAGTTDISGATGSSYTLVDDDAGLTIKVKVSFFDDKNNPETLTSAATTEVLANVPGAPEHLNVSLHDTGALDVSWGAPATDGGSAITEYRVQWKETAGNWDTPADVSEETATGTTHTIAGLTDGVEYAVRVVAANDVGDGPPSDEATGTPRETTPPELSTATVDGATLTLTYDKDLDENSEPSPDAFSVTAGGTGRAVDGVSVSSSSVTLTLGSAVTPEDTVTVSYTVPPDAAAPRIQDDAGNPAASFSDQDMENNTPPPANTPATGAPTISGTAQVGETLTVDTSGIGDDDGLPAESEFDYQWIRNDGSTDANIGGATDSTYVLLAADVGKFIKVRVTFTDKNDYPETLTSAATAAVEAASPAPGPITGFTVVDASDQSVEGTLADGGTLALDDPVGGSFGIRADLESGATIGSMSLELTGAKTHDQTENIAPYSLYGDSGGNLSGESLPVGEYTLTATAYSEARLGGNVLGTLKVSFSVTETATQQTNTPATGAPAISGTAQVGETLTVDTSGIDDADGIGNATFSYQWIAGTTDISGATGSTYAPLVADLGKTIKVRVSFDDDQNNFESLTSAATAAVAAKPNTPATGLPTISGTAQVGETLTVDTSGIDDADGIGNATFSYQWIAGTTDISRATGSSYAPLVADVGKTIKVRVSFDDDLNFLETLTSEATATVVTPLTAEFQDAPVDHPGTGFFTFVIAFSEPISISYKTLRDDSLEVTNGSATKAKRVDGQSDLWEITVEPDSNADVTVVLPATGDCTAQDAVCTRDGTKLSNRSELTVPGPAAANTPATGAPIISGTAQVGETLTVDTSGIDDADGMSGAVFSYQWLANGADVAGATSDTYTLVDADVGKAIKVRVIFTDNRSHQETLTSAATAAVEPRPNSLATGAPSISGTVRVGETLTADTSGIDDADGMSGAVFSYQWLANGADVAGATSDTYTLVDDDAGKTIKVRVSFTDDRSHQETRTSDPTAAVAAAEESSSTWSATLTVGSYEPFLGYYSFTGTGQLDPAEFSLDGNDYTVQSLGDKGSDWFEFGLANTIPGDFTLQVGGTGFDSVDATIVDYGLGYIYRWDDRTASLSEGDTVEVSLTVSTSD